MKDNSISRKLKEKYQKNIEGIIKTEDSKDQNKNVQEIEENVI